MTAVAVAAITAIGGALAAWFTARRAASRDATTDAAAERTEDAINTSTLADLVGVLAGVQTTLSDLKVEVRSLAIGIKACPFYSDHVFPERL